MKRKRVLVCGGRAYLDKERIHRALDDYCSEHDLWLPPDKYGNTLPGNITIIHGGAAGAGQIAGDWATVNWTMEEVYHADWKQFGRAAGPIQNQRMLDIGKPDIVLAFPGGRGTADLVKRAKIAGIEVREFEDEIA